ncbi:MAG TPA: hypothetical protein VFR61_04020 [Nitrososphaeraceae archaeon]|nr:hypothetical protein [Nitrososphaeraceae archaeon]
MKISELCSMIQESIQAGRYPFENENQKKYSKFVKIVNRSDSEDLKSNDIRIEVQIQELFTLNNYVANMEHLPGIIELDILDSYKMLCRRLERVSSDLITNI